MRTLVVPFALATCVPLSVMVVALERVGVCAEGSTVARVMLSIAAAIAAGALAYDLSRGRHFAQWAVRGPWIMIIVGGSAAVVWWGSPRIARMAKETVLLAASGAAGAGLFWTLDAFGLPRLYPGFHDAAFAFTLAGAAMLAVAVTSVGRPRVTWGLGLGGLTLGCAAVLWAPVAARRLRSYDNLRLILVEKAPLMGRAVRVASIVAPPLPVDEDSPSSTESSANLGESSRTLDWTGSDVVLLSVDALRADHVSAYGYPRATTPNIDALAREGTLFEQAYCPTPHTSYSVTSLMTGKYMRPLLSIGMGADSETWAASLRRYGYRTAAFYPPAVFFIDEARFSTFRERGLDFEYRKVEFASPALRVEQVRAYLDSAPATSPLFLWVHLFEPHEPYVEHEGHTFGPQSGRLPRDAYDSEVAAADAGIGELIKLIRSKRPRAVFMITADHGEEFGEHGGHYHGTTVYEEQVRVPLVVVGAGVRAHRVSTVVQTIDLLPTVLSAMGIPRPARIRGRDLGGLLASAQSTESSAPDASLHADPGLAFAEVDDYALVARGDLRLICQKKAGACSVYRLSDDPGETHDVGHDMVDATKELRQLSTRIVRDHGRYEADTETAWPDALRRGLQGDHDVAEDVAALLDDANVGVRRKAAEVTFRIHNPAVAAAVARSLARDEDEEVRAWCALALVRMGEPIDTRIEPYVASTNARWKRVAALALAERGDPRGGDELLRAWLEEGPPKNTLDFEGAKELLAAIAKIRPKGAAAALIPALEDVRLRPWVAEAIGNLGDRTARSAVLASFREERYVNARAAEARALLALGVREELRAPLTHFAGLPEPMPEAIVIAQQAGLLSSERGGWSFHPTPGVDASAEALTIRLTVPSTQHPLRLLVLVGDRDEPLSIHREGSAGGEPLNLRQTSEYVLTAEIDPPGAGRLLVLTLPTSTAVQALWIVPQTEEVR